MNTILKASRGRKNELPGTGIMRRKTLLVLPYFLFLSIVCWLSESTYNYLMPCYLFYDLQAPELIRVCSLTGIRHLFTSVHEELVDSFFEFSLTNLCSVAVPREMFNCFYFIHGHVPWNDAQGPVGSFIILVIISSICIVHRKNTQRQSKYSNDMSVLEFSDLDLSGTFAEGVRCNRFFHVNHINFCIYG